MNYLYKIFFIGFILFFANNIFAMNLVVGPSKDNVSIGEEFYVDVNLDVGSQSINGLEGDIIYDAKQFELVRVENARSFITHWITSTYDTPGRISLSGILPNGFGGFLNKPGESLNTGNITRLVFKPLLSGSSVLGFQNFLVTLNDGEGTIVKIKDEGTLLKVGDAILNSTYNVNDLNKPTLDAEIIKDSNLYAGNAVLVFNAIDKDSGVQGVYLKIKKDWVKISNPYNLEDVNLGPVLSVKAVDYAGNFTTKTFLLPGYTLKSYLGVYIVFGVLLLLSLFGYFYKKYVKNKKQL